MIANDPLFAEAVALVRETQKPNISLVQRKLHIRYSHAARLLELMEAQGIVTPMAFNGKRKLIKAMHPATAA